jgi:hypothetical protein
MIGRIGPARVADGARAVLPRADVARILVLCVLADEEGRVALSLNDKTPPLGETGFRIFLVAGTCNRLCLPLAKARLDNA